ncbi:hypothetical protein ACFYV7_15065 [Nocardia suismassiliense]|uniref:Uncharacterized protein n=1 Tax=Nocardia suismassiliense TaxID=2077092 RepID=A0ABW6QSA5_9NOCA
MEVGTVLEPVSERYLHDPNSAAGMAVLDKFSGLSLGSTRPPARAMAWALLTHQLETLVDPVEQVIVSLVDEVISADGGVGGEQISGLLKLGDGGVVVAVCETSNRASVEVNDTARGLCSRIGRSRYGTGTLTQCWLRIDDQVLINPGPTAFPPPDTAPTVAGAAFDELERVVRRYRDYVSVRVTSDRLRAFGIVREDALNQSPNDEIHAMRMLAEQQGWVLAGIFVGPDDTFATLLPTLNDPFKPAHIVVAANEEHLAGGWLAKFGAVVSEVWSVTPPHRLSGEAEGPTPSDGIPAVAGGER